MTDGKEGKEIHYRPGAIFDDTPDVVIPNNVIPFGGITRLDIPADKVLDSAKHLKRCMVIGEEEDGTFYAASTTGDMSICLWWAQNFIHKLMSGDYDEGMEIKL